MNVPHSLLPRFPSDHGTQASPYLTAPQAGPEEDAVDLRRLLLPIWRLKWVVVGTTLAALAISTIAVLNSVPKYTAYARVIFDPERLRIIDLNDVIVQQDVSSIGLQNQIEILRSSILLERVVDLLRLENTPEFNPDLAPDPSLPRRIIGKVQERAHQAAVRLGIVPEPRPVQFTEEEEAARRNSAMVAAVNDDLVLLPVPNSRVIELRFTSTNPRLAASIVNTIGEQYIIVETEAKRDDIAAATELLGTRVQDLESRLNTSKEAIEIARLEVSREEGQSSELTQTQLETLNGSLTSVRINRADLENRASRAAEALEDGESLWEVREFRDSPIINSHRVRELALENEIAVTRSIVGARIGDPTLTRLEAQLDEVRRNIREEAASIVAALANDVETAADRETALVQEINELEIRAIEQTRAELRLDQLEREAQANQTIYEDFLRRMKETSEQASLQTSDARFLTRGNPPGGPDTATGKRTVLLAGLGGLGLGIAIAMLLEQLSRSFRNPNDLETRTGLPVLAAVPQAGMMKRPRDLLKYYLAKPNTAFAEAVRNLRTSILFSNRVDPPRVIMFTSSVPAEGKSTAAMLVAVTSQQMGRSAIVVDCDFRHRTLSAVFPSDANRPGLIALLEGRAALDAAIITEPESGLHVLTLGPGEHAGGNPADVLASQRFASLINELRSRYDLIVLDTPPALVVTDSRILAGLSDAVVYLVRWDHTNRNAVLEGLRELASVNANLAGVAFTLVNERRASKHVDNEYFYKRRYKNYIGAA